MRAIEVRRRRECGRIVAGAVRAKPRRTMRRMRQTIAVVDDEETIRETVAFALRRDGYDVVTFADGGAAWDVVKDKLPSLAILDITMPRMDGLELCRRLRARSDTLPIIFLTSRDEELDRVLGLELGADDYLCKPFSMRELAARVKVLFRRLSFIENPSASQAEAPLRCGALALDLQRYMATWNDARVDLTVTEFMMLHALVRHPGHVAPPAGRLDRQRLAGAFGTRRRAGGGPAGGPPALRIALLRGKA